MDWKKGLQDRFGERACFDPTERLLYSHDVASLPGAIRRLFRTTPDAIVQPSCVEELAFLADLGMREGVYLVPRGAGTSGYGGALPTRGGIVVEFNRMDRILGVDEARGLVTVEPGVIWADLERELRKRGWALRMYPTSALGSTVGGWVAEGGTGIGSYEYGYVPENVAEVDIVTPRGEVRRLSGEDLALACGAEGITGFISRVTLPIRRAEPDVPVVAAFEGSRPLLDFLLALGASGLPAWHVSFQTMEFIEKKEEATRRPTLPRKPIVLIAFPASREAELVPGLDGLVESCGGEMLPRELALHEWDERFYPMRLKRLGPSLIPSEAVVPVERLGAILHEVSEKLQGLALEGTLVSRDHATLLGFLSGDERSMAYSLGYAKSLMMSDIARRHGGRTYSVGLFFTDQASEILGPEKANMLSEFKRGADPRGIFNPGKVLGSNSPALRAAMAAARVARPLLPVVEAAVPKAPRESAKLPRSITFEAYACAQCGYCRNACTLYGGRRWESSSPRGKWYFLRKYAEGKVQLSQEMVDTFLLCTTCKRCNDVCQVNIPIQELWDELRGILVQEKGHATFPAFEMMGASFSSQNNIWASFREDRDAWLPEGIRVKDHGPIGYWAGCTASYVEKDIAQNAVRILSDGGVPFTYLGKDEACCGVPFMVAGKWDVFQKALSHNVRHLKERGVKELVVSCPGCWVALEHYYSEWAPKLGLGWDIKITHITEVAARLVRKGKLEFRKPLDMKVTWHDPCHIGRHGGIYEPPREVLRAMPGLEFSEMEHNREDGLCCGSVLTRIGEPSTSDIIASRRISEAEAVGAETIITTCPCCEFQLRVGGKAAGSGVRVMDFAALVGRALGYESEDPTEYVHEMWGVFYRAIQSMSLKGMAEMMIELMPGMFGLMPGTMRTGMNVMRGLPGGVKDAMVGMMGAVMPAMMPGMMKEMMPRMMPTVLELMEKRIPDMPDAMRRLMPEMLPMVMEALMPAALPRLIPLIKTHMIEAMRQELSRKGA